MTAGARLVVAGGVVAAAAVYQVLAELDLAVGADEWLAVRPEPVQVGSVHFSQGQPGRHPWR